MKKIWVISELYYPVLESTGYYITEISTFLAKKGLDVHVITTDASYNQNETNAPFKEIDCSGLTVTRLNVPAVDKNNFIKRCFGLLIISIKLFYKVLRAPIKSDDEVLIVTNPAFLLLCMPIVKAIKNIEYTILVHDVFPENLVAINILKKKSVLYKCILHVFNKAYSAAKTCISIGRDMSEILYDKVKDKSSIVLIPNWSQNDFVFPKEKQESDLCNKLNLTGKFIFQFAGNLGKVQGIDNLLEAIKKIKNSEIHFLFIGNGAMYDTIQKFILENGNQNTTLIPFQDRNNQTDFLNACDISIITLNEGMYGLGVPSKFYNILAAGKPIIMIGDKMSEIGRCIDEYKNGWIVEPNDSETLKETIESIYENRANLDLLSKTSRKLSDEVFAKDIILNKFYTLLK